MTRPPTPPPPSPATTPAGRELDALVAEQVMGWVVVHYSASGLGFVTGRHIGFNPATTNYYELPNGNDPDGIKKSDLSYDASYWSPSTDIAAAWTVVEQMQSKGWDAKLIRTGDGYGCDFDNMCETHYARVDPREGGMPLAIARAALTAIAAPVESHFER